MLKRFLLVLLILVMLLPACAGNEAQKFETIKAGEAENIDTTTGRLQPNIPSNINYNGDTFMFLVTGPEYGAGYYETKDVFSEAQDGETLNDAVYMRNRAVEDKLNINIAEFKSRDVKGTARKSISSGDKEYDAIFTPMYECAALAQEKILLDIKEVPYINLDKPWWDKATAGELAIRNKLYYTTGEISTAVKSGVYMVIFNKYLMEEYKIGNPYDNVKNETWTFDVYAQMVKSLYVDVNGNGERDDEDIYGSLMNTYDPFFFTIGFGGRYTTNDAEGYPQITVDSELVFTAVDKIWDLYYDFGSARYLSELKLTGDYSNVFTYYRRGLFASDKFLFILGLPLVFHEFRDMESNFGLLPMPKYDEKQTRYYHTIDYTVVMLCLPITCDAEKSGIVLEAMAAESMYTLSPAFGETLLLRKYIRDDESEFVLDIVNKSRVYDLSIIFSWGGLGNVIQATTAGKNRNLASEIQKIYDRALTEIEKTVTAFEE